MPNAGWKEVGALLLRRRRRLRVVGPSMQPTLAEGDVVLVDRRAQIAEGDVVCAIHPTIDGLRIVKRAEFFVDDRVYLSSDNRSASDVADSRTFGPVPRRAIIGRVTSRLESTSARANQ